jgi:hypothetical protein
MHSLLRSSQDEKEKVTHAHILCQGSHEGRTGSTPASLFGAAAGGGCAAVDAPQQLGWRQRSIPDTS